MNSLAAAMRVQMLYAWVWKNNNTRINSVENMANELNRKTFVHNF